MTPWTNLGPLRGSRVHLSLVIRMIGEIAATSQPQPPASHSSPKTTCARIPSLFFLVAKIGSLLMAEHWGTARWRWL